LTIPWQERITPISQAPKKTVGERYLLATLNTQANRMTGVTRTSLRGIGLPCLIGLLLAACGSSDDAVVSSPKPTVNPSAKAKFTLKVVPQLGSVDAVTATGDWVISNHACAPKRPFSGAPAEETVHADAKVSREGDNFDVTIFSDQFLSDDCQWVFVGTAIRLLRNGRIVGVASANHDDILKRHGALQMVCEPASEGPWCLTYAAAEKSILKHPARGQFSFTIEEVPNVNDDR
jgi:hypothetical protein